MSFLISTASNARMMMDRLALVLGLVLLPLLVYLDVGLDLMWTGIIGGTLAYAVHRLREAATMNPCIAELWPYLMLILVGFLPNEVWRVLGLVLARGLNEDSEIVMWSRAVATAILAGVIAKLILFSSGALDTIPIWVRVAASALRLPRLSPDQALGLCRRGGRRVSTLVLGGYLTTH